MSSCENKKNLIQKKGEKKMKRNWMVLIVIAVFAMVFVTGCKDDTTDPGLDEFEILSQYMLDNGMDLPTMLIDAYTMATDVNDDPAAYFIMDIRKGDKYGPVNDVWPDETAPNGVTDYDDGHIEGSHSVALADVVTFEAANNTGLPVVVACYTGHDAGHAVMALRLSGVSATSLKWGMSAWNGNFDLWTGHTGNAADNYPGSWIEDDTVPALPTYTEIPEISTDLEDGAEILANQITNRVLDGLNGVVSADVLSDYDAYDLYNYWAVTDWVQYGHITTSYQVTPGDLSIASLDMLNPTGINVIYCWSGQTASLVAAWLNVLGYDGKTLKFGANEMIYDTLEGHKWSGSADYGYE
jgi:rhodanese-related sulfurtransferase